ncbi:MAG TPA: ATP-binding protein [Candidatus Eremiobacteraeota bacterium]|nr:MAG: Sensor protein SrrB [bacterium ADurb.Bin363]HPZ09452.1 ATP-binding protein [Candidatus Eremiobacteraeota bacterium]
MSKKGTKTRMITNEIMEHLSLFYETVRLFNSSLDIEEVLNTVIDKVIEVFEGERGFVMLYNKETEKLEIMVARNMDKQNISELDLSISMSVANKVFNTGESILSTNAMNDPSIRSKSIILHDIRSVLCVPIKLKEEAIGVIYTDSRMMYGVFDPQEQNLLTTLANQAATAIENARLYKQVSDNFKKIQELEEIKNEFISIISHELRTPIVPIKGYIYTLKQYAEVLSQEERTEILDTIDGRVEHLSRLINDLLTVASIETEKSMRLFKEVIDITQLIKDTIKPLKKKYLLHNFVLNIYEPLKLEVDITKLSHALYHIMDNGAKFSPDGGDINICINKNKTSIEINIKDQGIGIKEEHLEKIFDKFYQVDASSTRSFEGMGTGLYIARSIVEAHKGFITVESTVGGGSTFKVILPVQST